MNRQKFNEKRFKLGEMEISLMQLISLIVINLSLVAVILNLFIKGQGSMQWWSIYVVCILVFSYLMLRIFTSSGLVLGRQVTLLATVFNFFLNIANFLGIVGKDASWQLTWLIPAVNLSCLMFLVVAFIIRKKRFRAIILPSFSITMFSILPIVRLYIAEGDNFTIPTFAIAVLAIAFGLLANALTLNWLGLRQAAEKNFADIKKGVDGFKRASEKVSVVNKKIEDISNSAAAFKKKWQARWSSVKRTFSFKKKKAACPEIVIEPSQDDNIRLIAENTVNEEIVVHTKSKSSLYLKIKQNLTKLFSFKKQKGVSVEQSSQALSVDLIEAQIDDTLEDGVES